MRSLLRDLNLLFDRATKRRLVFATFGSVLVALLDTLAIALVLPLVELATGSSVGSGPVAFIARLLGNPDPDRLIVMVTAGVVVLFILKDLAQMAFQWWLTGFIAIERIKTSARILEHYLFAPYTQISRRSTAELVRTMDGSVMQVFNYTVNGLMSAVSNAIAILAIAVALIIVAPVPTLAVAAYFSLAAAIFARVVKPKAVSAGERLTMASLQGWRTGLAAIGGIKELKLRGTQKFYVDRYLQASLEGAYAGRVANFLGGLPRYVLEILFILAIGLILMVSALTSGSGPGQVVGLLALFVAAGFRVLPSISGYLASSSNIKVGGAALELVLTELEAARGTVTRESGTAGPLPIEDVLRVEDVTFSYPAASRPALRSVTLDVPRGASVALVGGSGAGKTTLVDVILGLHQPDHGRVTVDGVDIRSATKLWRKSVGYVPQDVYILDATLAENIAFDQVRSDIDDGRLHEAIAQAQLTDVVAELESGVDTELGDKGTRLSGGQRQRVGIARALYRGPQLLVLDEATSALDNETEHRISETITRLHGEITLVIVAHRLSTVRHADVIVFMKDGRVKASGTFEDLRARDPEFARLVALGALTPSTDGAGAAATSPVLELRD